MGLYALAGGVIDMMPGLLKLQETNDLSSITNISGALAVVHQYWSCWYQPLSSLVRPTLM
jgi:hypothetical protein